MNPRPAAKVAKSLLFHAMGKGSFRMPGKLFGIDHAYLYRRIRKFGESLPDPEVAEGIREMPFDETGRFVGSRKTNVGSSRPLIVAHGKPWRGARRS
jgi:hypothetical protein